MIERGKKKKINKLVYMAEGPVWGEMGERGTDAANAAAVANVPKNMSQKAAVEK